MKRAQLAMPGDLYAWPCGGTKGVEKFNFGLVLSVTDDHVMVLRFTDVKWCHVERFLPDTSWLFGDNIFMVFREGDLISGKIPQK